MMYKYSALFSLFVFGALSLVAQRSIRVVDAAHNPIANVVVTSHPQGKLLGTTNKEGRCWLPQHADSVGISHLAYRSAIVAVEPLLQMDTLAIALREAVILPTQPDYYRLRCVLRQYQYIDSTLVLLLDGIVDYYVNAVGERPRLQVRQMEAFLDKDYIRGRLVAKKGIVNYDNLDNSVCPWTNYRSVFGRDADYQLVEDVEGWDVYKRKGHSWAGAVREMAGGQKLLKIDVLLPEDSVKQSFLSMQTTIHRDRRELMLSPQTDLEQVHPRDVQSYRAVFERTLHYGKKGRPINTTRVQEIMVLSCMPVSKKELKALDTTSFCETINESRSPVDGQMLRHSLPIPPAVERLLGVSLERLPEKKK